MPHLVYYLLQRPVGRLEEVFPSSNYVSFAELDRDMDRVISDQVGSEGYAVVGKDEDFDAIDAIVTVQQPVRTLASSRVGY